MRLDDRFEFRLTCEEKKLLFNKAALCGLKPGSYLRKTIREDKIIIEDIEGKREIAREINKIGVNLNQITRMVNMNGNINNQEIDEIRNQFEMILKLIKKNMYE